MSDLIVMGDDIINFEEKNCRWSEKSFSELGSKLSVRQPHLKK